MLSLGITIGIGFCILVWLVLFIINSSRVAIIRRQLLNTEVKRCTNEVFDALIRHQNPNGAVSHLSEKLFFYFNYSSGLFEKEPMQDLNLLLTKFNNTYKNWGAIQVQATRRHRGKNLLISVNDRFYTQNLRSISQFKEVFPGDLFWLL